MPTRRSRGRRRPRQVCARCVQLPTPEAVAEAVAVAAEGCAVAVVVAEAAEVAAVTVVEVVVAAAVGSVVAEVVLARHQPHLLVH